MLPFAALRRGLASRATIFLSLGALLVGTSARAQQISNPDLFAKSLAAAQEAVDQYHNWDDAAATRRITEIGYRVAAASGAQFPISIYLIDMREPNAFSLPAGQVFVARGILDLGPTDDELAALLGHEIAHVKLEHGSKMERRAALLNVLSSAVLVGVILAERNAQPQAGVPVYGPGPESSSYTSGAKIQGAAAASLILSELLLRSYSRDYEDQADEEGQRTAAAAGYDPHGMEQLFALMNARLPQSHEYGYWRTHPFFEERVTSAIGRGKLLKAQQPRSDEKYRVATQESLLGFEPKPGKDQSEQKQLLAQAALRAWPQGGVAEKLRLDDLHRVRDTELVKTELSRDYGKVIEHYDAQIAEVRALTPQTAFLATLEGERKTLRGASEALFPKAEQVLAAGVYETAFLEAYVSNYPKSPQAPRLALELAGAYARTGKQAESVDRYLEALRADPKGPVGERSLAGLRALATVVTDLASLQQLTTEVADPELQKVAGDRLAKLATSYASLKDGDNYLRRFPQGLLADKVASHLDQLAEKAYGEMVLYQGVGDTLKALDRIEQILTHAPLSHAADRLRERTVLAS